MLNMFRTSIYPSSGACDYSVELPHWFYCSWFGVCWRSRLKHSHASTCNLDTTPTQPHRISNTHRTKNNTTDVVIQQNSFKLLMMDILMSEICWAHKKWNKITSDIKLVFLFFNYHNDARSNKHKKKISIIRLLQFFERTVKIFIIAYFIYRITLSYFMTLQWILFRHVT